MRARDNYYRALAAVAALALAGALLLVLGIIPTQAQERTQPQEATTEEATTEEATTEEGTTETKENYKYRDGDPDGEVLPGEVSEAASAEALEESSGVDEDPEGNPYVAGELLVTYIEDTSQATQDQVDQESEAKVLDKMPKLDSSLLSFPEIKNEQSKEAREQALEQKKQELEQDPNVEAVGYNYIRQAVQETQKESTEAKKKKKKKKSAQDQKESTQAQEESTQAQEEPAATPNDPYFGAQWGPLYIRAPQAWDTATGNGAAIAVLDTGIDRAHPDVGSKVTAERDLCANDGTANEEHGHGTHVAGIAAANTNNNTGVAGTAPNASLQVAKVLCGTAGRSTDGSVQAGIDWAMAAPAADVINMSLGGCGNNPAQEAAINRAWNAGTLVVAAAGNEAQRRCLDGNGNPFGPINPVQYPAAYANSFAVGAINYGGTRSNFSSYHSYVDVAAPGGNTNPYVQNQTILSTYPLGFQNNTGVNGYQWSQGTSQAAPMVSGLAGLLAGQGLNASEIWQRIESTAGDLGPPWKDVEYGYGLVNAQAAVLNHKFYGPATRDYYTGWDSSSYGYGIAYRYANFVLYGYLVPSHAGTYTEVKFLFAYNGLLYDSGKRTHAYNYEQGGYSLFYQPYAPPLNSPGWWVARATDADSGLYKDTWIYVY